VPADPDVLVRVYCPHQAQGAVVWLYGGGWVVGNQDTEDLAPATKRLLLFSWRTRLQRP
jgi:acetyl esterase/lipase